MLLTEPNIVVIDDKRSEVEGIIASYREDGFGVKFYNADLSEGDCHPTTPHADVNLIFLDLYYKNDFDADLCVGWINEIVSKEAFYILVIWSKDGDAHTDEIEEKLSKIDKKPFCSFAEVKSDYMIKNSATDSTDPYNWDNLLGKINSKLAQIPELYELAAWKRSVLSASNVVVGHLAGASETSVAELRPKLQKVIKAHGGKNIEDAPPEQKRKTLFDALDNVLLSNTKDFICDEKNTEILSKNEDKLYGASNEEGTSETGLLNSWFHFTVSNEKKPVLVLEPGVICTCKGSVFEKNVNTLQLDDNIKKFLSSSADNSKEVVDIVLLITPPCDIAQNKVGNNVKLLSGIYLKNPIFSNSKLSDLKKRESVQMYEHLSIDGNSNAMLIFDFRYVFTLPQEKFIGHFDKLKTFNKDYLSEILVKYAAYSSRLGVTQLTK